MNKKETKEIKMFFLKKKVTAIVFTATIAVFFLLNVINLYKEKPELKDDAMKFLFTEDFYFFFEKGKAERVIELFYNEV